MLLEVLVISVCVNQQGGCSEATSAYYKQSKDLQTISENAEKLGKKLAAEHEWLVYTATPIYALASRQPAKILLYKGTILSIDPFKQAIGIQWNY
jgi:hypothetical protein